MGSMSWRWGYNRSQRAGISEESMVGGPTPRYAQRFVKNMLRILRGSTAYCKSGPSTCGAKHVAVSPLAPVVTMSFASETSVLLNCDSQDECDPGEACWDAPSSPYPSSPLPAAFAPAFGYSYPVSPSPLKTPPRRDTDPAQDSAFRPAGRYPEASASLLNFCPQLQLSPVVPKLHCPQPSSP